EHVRIDVTVSRRSTVLVRTTYDAGWHAALDGHAVPLLRADYLLQAVDVPAGRHTIELTYDDPSIGFGLLGSVLSVLALLGSALGLRLRRRSPPVGQSGPDGDRDRRRSE